MNLNGASLYGKHMWRGGPPGALGNPTLGQSLIANSTFILSHLSEMGAGRASEHAKQTGGDGFGGVPGRGDDMVRMVDVWSSSDSDPPLPPGKELAGGRRCGRGGAVTGDEGRGKADKAARAVEAQLKKEEEEREGAGKGGAGKEGEEASAGLSDFINDFVDGGVRDEASVDGLEMMGGSSSS